LNGRPSLPDGYQAQPVWGFRGPTGATTYEFNRVYRPPARRGRRGPSCRLDEALSYWHELPAGRWLTYAQARRLSDGLTFEQFSSERWMRERVDDHWVSASTSG
jgi:hypothetical protein